jgi:hypothetical protein
MSDPKARYTRQAVYDSYDRYTPQTKDEYCSQGLYETDSLTGKIKFFTIDNKKNKWDYRGKSINNANSLSLDSISPINGKNFSRFYVFIDCDEDFQDDKK